MTFNFFQRFSLTFFRSFRKNYLQDDFYPYKLDEPSLDMTSFNSTHMFFSLNTTSRTIMYIKGGESDLPSYGDDYELCNIIIGQSGGEPIDFIVQVTIFIFWFIQICLVFITQPLYHIRIFLWFTSMSGYLNTFCGLIQVILPTKKQTAKK